MKKCLTLGIILLFVGTGIFPAIAQDTEKPLPASRGTWLYVGGSGLGNYSKIQDAIDNASTYDTVYVYTGIYYENIIIATEGLTLAGQDKHSTVIYSTCTAKHAISIQASYVTVQGFSIENATALGTVWDASGVFLCSSHDVVEDNIIGGNSLGLCALSTAFNLTICHNSFLDSGILFGNYQHTPENPEVPVECFLHNMHNNTVNGKPLYYFKNVSDFIIPADAGQVILANCTNVTVKESYFTQCNFPIALNYCTGCVVEQNTVKDSYGEIITMCSKNCIFQNNTIDSIIFGVCLDQKSRNNIVRFNTVTNSTGGVVVMIESSHNLVYENSFHDNLLGIRLFQRAHNNSISRNTIQQNRIGILLSEDPYNNAIENNTFVKNFLQVQSLGRTKNFYHNNYWGRPRVLPKFLFGWFTTKNVIPSVAIPYCITGIDWHPAKEPYDR